MKNISLGEVVKKQNNSDKEQTNEETSVVSNYCFDYWQKQITNIRQDIKKNKSIFIYGQKSIPSHFIINHILENIYVPIYLSSLTLRNQGWDELIANYNHHNLVYSLSHESKSNDAKPRVIIIDQLDNLHTLVDKTYLMNILKKRNKYTILVILLGEQNESQKTFDEIKKRCEVVYQLESIKLETQISFIKDSISANKLSSISLLNEKNIISLIATTDGDLYQTENIITYILRSIDNEHDCETFISRLPSSSTDLTIFEAFRRVISLNNLNYELKTSQEEKTQTSETDIRIVYQLYKHNKVLLPLTLYENMNDTLYMTLMNDKKINKKNKKYISDYHTALNKIYEMVAYISECISLADMIETNIYSDQNWHIQFLHCAIALLCPIVEINKIASICNKRIKIPNHLGYSTELNRASLKNINRKNIGHIDAYFNCSLEDYTMMNYICNHLNQTEDSDLAMYYFEPISCENSEQTLKLYDMLSKLDKTNDMRITTPISIRRALQKYLIEKETKKKINKTKKI